MAPSYRNWFLDYKCERELLHFERDISNAEEEGQRIRPYKFHVSSVQPERLNFSLSRFTDFHVDTSITTTTHKCTIYFDEIFAWNEKFRLLEFNGLSVEER